MRRFRAAPLTAPEAASVLAVPEPVDVGKVVLPFSLTFTLSPLNRPFVSGVVFLTPLALILQDFFAVINVVLFLVLGTAVFTLRLMFVLTSKIDSKLVDWKFVSTSSAGFVFWNIIALTLIPFTFLLISFSLMFCVAFGAQASSPLLSDFWKLLNCKLNTALTALFHYSLPKKLYPPIRTRKTAVITVIA